MPAESAIKGALPNLSGLTTTTVVLALLNRMSSEILFVGAGEVNHIAIAGKGQDARGDLVDQVLVVGDYQDSPGE